MIKGIFRLPFVHKCSHPTNLKTLLLSIYSLKNYLLSDGYND